MTSLDVPEDHRPAEGGPAAVTGAKYAAMKQAAELFVAELEFMAGVYPSSTYMYDQAKKWADTVKRIDLEMERSTSK
jgi:hypothetical protein